MSKLRKTKRELYSVVHLGPDKPAKSDWLEKSDLAYSMFAPVVWDGKPAELRFWNYRKAATNHEATDLFDRMGFTIGGSAYVVTGTAMFHVLEIDQRVQEVERDLSPVFLDEPPIVRQFRTDYWRTRVYTRNKNDAFCIRLRLR